MGSMRVLLAISVVLAHSVDVGIFQGFGGPNAVEVFFLISGFYISEILSKTYKSKKRFYMNRALRLYPIYFYVCFCVMVFKLLSPNGFDEYFSSSLKIILLTLFANITLIGGDFLMFLQTDGQSLRFGPFHESNPPLHEYLLVPQSWSLGLEILFYLLAPFLIRLKTIQIIVCVAVLLSARTFFYFLGLDYDPWTYRFFPFELPLFLIGIILSRIKERGINFRISSLNQLYLAITSFLFSGIILNQTNIPRIFSLLVAIFASSVLVLCTKQSIYDRKIGELSYPIYISHLCVIWWVSGIMNHNQFLQSLTKHSWLIITINILGTVIFSFILLMLTRNIERLRERVRLEPA